jgi:phage shock protein A
MGLIDRILRIIRATINNLISQAEDPEKILEQSVMDMQEDLLHMRQAVAQAIATQKRTERQFSQAQSQAQEWYQRAQLALQKGDENLARQALTRRKSYHDTANAMEIHLQQQTELVNRMKQDMRLLEGKIAEAKTKKDLYIARARSAQATQKMNEMLGNINTKGASNAFERMEEKVLQLEAQAEAVGELNSSQLENKFAALQGADEIENELAALRTQIGGENQLPPAKES